jgi:putative ABC transport system permease protein
MGAVDSLLLAWGAITANRLRTLLILISMAIGVAAVILLTALGDGARRYVVGEFASLGTNLLIVLPGRSETVGGPPPLFGETPRDLTIDDAAAIERHRYIRRVAPVVVGNAPVSTAGGLEREITILGSSAAMRELRHLELAQGKFLPPLEPGHSAPVCVLGYEARTELFGNQSVLGTWIRIGDRRFRVIGVLAESGVSIGVNFDDLAIIPVASAQALFNQASLFRIIAEARSALDIAEGAKAIHKVIAERHEGEDDVTVITQDTVIATFDRILGALTLGVAGIAGISLAVAGILIMNVMLVSVTQRTAEIGVFKAIGASRRDVARLFVIEAALLSFAGALLGLAIGMASAELVHRIYAKFPIVPPLWAIGAALIIAVGTGLLFGVLPARRAARLDPVSALSRR